MTLTRTVVTTLTQPQEATGGEDEPEPPLLRHPRAGRGDGQLMWRLADQSEALETNSEYAYHLFAEYFADTCLIAEVDGETAGFVLAFRPPRSPETLFVWQIGVDPHFRGRGVATYMLQELLARSYDDGVRYLEATVTPSNTASQRTFHSYAREQCTTCEEAPLFPTELFSTDDHETEMRFRIGPIDRRDAPEPSEELWDFTRSITA